MLYLPLKNEEKFKAKAIIDVFAYRSSKAVASLIIIALQVLQLDPISTVSLLYNSNKTNYIRGIDVTDT